MAIVFLLQHSYEIETETAVFDETKLIGVFSTREKAEIARDEYKKLSGFKDYPDDFHIDRIEIDKRHWEEGFITWEEATENVEETKASSMGIHLNIDLLIKEFDKEKFLEAAEEAKKAAPKTGKGLNGFSSEIPHELSNKIWDSKLGLYEKTKLVFQLYDRMPCYAALMYIKHHYNEFESETKDYLWRRIKEYILSKDEVLSKPIEYMLWCDYFEDPTVVEEAWTSLLEDPVDEELIERCLLISGPVSYTLKSRLYDKLIDDRRWHYFIFKSLLFSAQDYYGNIDKHDAKKYFEQLKVPQDSDNYKSLRDVLYNSI